MCQHFLLNPLSASLYLDIARDIVKELDLRGFTCDNADMANGLEDRISQIICDNLNKGLNISFVPAQTPEKIELPDGWENDLTNQ